MRRLKVDQPYHIIKIYPESGFYARRRVLEDEIIRCEAHGCQFNYPRFNPALPLDLNHALIRICSGFWRGQEILLTYFTVKLAETELCNCRVYQFPHKSGEGKCLT